MSFYELERPKLLNDQVYDALKANLLSGNYKHGDKIVESQIASELGVSRSPVREAITRLLQDGLLIQKGNNVHARKFSKKDMIDIYQTRKALESMAAELAAELRAEDDLKRMEKYLHLSEEAFKKGASKEVTDYNTKFHYTILEASNNRILKNSLESLGTLILYYRSLIFDNYQRTIGFLHEHKDIFEAIKNKNTSLAKKRMEKHIDADIEEFLHFLNKAMNHDESIEY